MGAAAHAIISVLYYVYEEYAQWPFFFAWYAHDKELFTNGFKNGFKIE